MHSLWQGTKIMVDVCNGDWSGSKSGMCLHYDIDAKTSEY